MSANLARKRVRIGDLLVEHKIISESQLQQALAEQKKSGRKLGRVLIAVLSTNRRCCNYCRSSWTYPI